MKRTLLVSVTALAALLVSTAQVGAQGGQRTLSLSATPTTVKFGGSVTLAGKLAGSNVDGRNVTVRQDPFPVDSFATGGSATTNAAGDWSLILKPASNTRYQARSGNTESPAVDVMVRPAITLRLSDRTPRRGQRVRFSGRLCPEHDGVAIALQRRGASGWRTVASPVLKDVAGATCSSYSRRLRVRRTGAYRASFAGDADHVAGTSRARRARVH
jgi:hypothetical protein